MAARDLAFAVLACLAIAPSSALAQGTARSLDIDPSVRSTGMGSASNAVFWDDVNAWANPALIGFQRGVRFTWGNEQLLPNLAEDVDYDSKVLTMGGYGVALLLSGEPFEALGGQRVSYGESEGTDPGGNPTGTFEAFEDIRSWGFGVSAAGIANAIATMRGGEPPVLTRWVDVALGIRAKRVEISLAPGFSSQGTAHDRGLVVRVTPFDGERDRVGPPLRIDLAYGWSDLSYDETVLSFGFESAPVSRHRRQGYAARLSVPMPAGLASSLQNDGLGWLASGLSPVFSFGFASDRDEVGPDPGYETEGSGFEVTFANVITLRRGNYEDRDGNIDDSTWGVGVGVPVGPYAAVRWDISRFPTADDSDIGDRESMGISGFVDVAALWRRSRAGGSPGTSD